MAQIFASREIGWFPAIATRSASADDAAAITGV